jgi:hypothetical protein
MAQAAARCGESTMQCYETVATVSTHYFLFRRKLKERNFYFDQFD